MIQNIGYDNRCNLIIVFNCVLFLGQQLKTKTSEKFRRLILQPAIK